jgi:hypothetical protein
MESVTGEVHRARLIDLLQMADAHVGTHLPANQDKSTRDQGLALALFANCRSMLRGITFLVREEHGQEATILMRTLLQDATTIFYILKNQPTTSEMTVRFEWGSLRQERLILEEGMKHAPDDETEAALAEVEAHSEQAKADAKELGIELKPLPPMHHAFAELGLPEGYYFFRFASHAVHTSRLALWSRMTELPDGRVTINFGGTPGPVLTVGLFCGELFLSVYRATSRLLNWTTVDEIDAFVGEHQARFIDLRKDAGITTKPFGHFKS